MVKQTNSLTGAAAQTQVGRPSSLTPEVADEILGRIAEGESLAAITRDDEHLPSYRSVYRGLESDEDFRRRYQLATGIRTEHLIDEIVEMSDEAKSVDEVQAARLRIDARKWLAAKLLPKKYGDKVNGDVHVSTAVTNTFSIITEQRQNEIQDRNRRALLGA
jgi:hypothetical protein